MKSATKRSRVFTLFTILLIGNNSKFVLSFPPMPRGAVRVAIEQPFIGVPQVQRAVQTQHGQRSLQSTSTRLFMFGLSAPAVFSGVTRRKVLKWIGALIVALPLIGELYSRLGGVDLSTLDFPQIPADAKEATLVFHGAGGPDQYTDILMGRLAKDSNSYSGFMNWFKYSQDTLQASFNGQTIGRELARRIVAQNPDLERLHLVGVSVGAFLVDQAVVELKKESKDLYIQQTLLDPFCGRGVLDFNYGGRNYGKAADYAQQFLNTDDPVPTTNSPLPNCVVYDVTGIRPPEIFGHDWPLAYYGSELKTIGFVSDNEKKERGVIIDVTT